MADPKCFMHHVRCKGPLWPCAVALNFYPQGADHFGRPQVLYAPGWGAARCKGPLWPCAVALNFYPLGADHFGRPRVLYAPGWGAAHCARAQAGRHPARTPSSWPRPSSTICPSIFVSLTASEGGRAREALGDPSRWLPVLEQVRAHAYRPTNLCARTA